MKQQPLFIVIILALAIVIIATVSCVKSSGREDKEDNADTDRIMTTINPYFLMTRQIVQDKIPVDLFIPANASPHTFSPAPADIINLEKARLVIANGLGLELQIAAKLQTIQERVCWAANALPAEKLLAFTGHDAEDGQEGTDPHIWLDPENLVLIARVILERVTALFPEQKYFFEQNWKILDDSIKQTDNEITAERTHYLEPVLVTFHNSFGYFLHKYNIKLAAVIESSPGKEPTARELLALGSKLSAVKAIFIEPQLNPRAAEIIAKEYNLLVDTLDPLGFYFRAASIYDILWKNWNVMKKYFTVIPVK